MKLKLMYEPKVQKWQNIEFSGEGMYWKREGTRTGTHRKGRDGVSAGEYDFEPRMITLIFLFEDLWKKAGIWFIKLILKFRLDQTTGTHELTNKAKILLTKIRISSMICKNGSTLDKGRSTTQSESTLIGYPACQVSEFRDLTIRVRKVRDEIWALGCILTKDSLWTRCGPDLRQKSRCCRLSRSRGYDQGTKTATALLTFFSQHVGFTYVSNLTSNMSGFSVSNLKFNLFFHSFFPFVAFSEIPCLIHQTHSVILNFWLISDVQIYQTYSLFSWFLIKFIV